MRGILSGEVPALHGALVTFTLGGRLHIDELPDTEVARTETETDRKEVLWGNWELGEVLLGWEVVFQVVAGLGLAEGLQAVLTNTNLDRIDAVLILCLYLSDLASIDLQDGARHDLAPLVPEVSSPYLVAKQASPLAKSVSRSCLFELELRVNLVLKGAEARPLVSNSVNVLQSELPIVEGLSLLQVLSPYRLQLSDCELCVSDTELRGTRNRNRGSFGRGSSEKPQSRSVEE